MSTEEQMIEEQMCALILVKLEELGRKLDDRKLRLDDTNQKLEEMNAQLCGRAVPLTSSSASSTSSPPQDAALVVSIATTEFPMVAPARCSMSGPNQDACVPVPTATSSTSPTASRLPRPLLHHGLSLLLLPSWLWIGACTSHTHEVFDVRCQPGCTPSGGCGDTLGSTPGRHPRRPSRHHQAHHGDAPQVFDDESQPGRARCDVCVDILSTAHAFVSLYGCSCTYKQAQRQPTARHHD
ncbi:unnamed protein product [Urochloa humidicola]